MHAGCIDADIHSVELQMDLIEQKMTDCSLSNIDRLPSDVEPLKALHAFKSLHDLLTDQLQISLVSVAYKLYANHIIKREDLVDAINESRAIGERTVSLLSVVEDKIGAESRVFTKFIRILESEPLLKLLGEDLVSIYIKGMSMFSKSACACINQ